MLSSLGIYDLAAPLPPISDGLFIASEFRLSALFTLFYLIDFPFKLSVSHIGLFKIIGGTEAPATFEVPYSIRLANSSTMSSTDIVATDIDWCKEVSVG